MQNISFQGNYIDLIVLVVLFLWMTDGWERGLFEVVTDLVSFLGAFLFGLLFYSRAAFIFIEYFTISRGFANALGFFLVYTVAHSLIAMLLVGVLRELPQRYFPRIWQKFLGIFPAAINGLIIISAILTLVVSLPVRHDIKEAISTSEVGGYLVRKTNVLERSLGNILGGAIEESLAFLTVQPETRKRIDLGFEVEEPDLRIAEQLELQMFDEVNEERVSRGITGLVWDQQIVAVARAHAMDMFERGYFSHMSPEGKDVGDRLLEADVNYSYAGENLALAPSLGLAHDGLMQSEGHRHNILASEFRKVGIGVVDGGSYGRMFVQVFAD